MVRLNDSVCSFLIIITFFLCCGSSVRAQDAPLKLWYDHPAGAGGGRLTSYVDAMIGAGGHGHVFVGASVPFGAVQVGPNNIPKGWDWCSGYHYSDSILIGFSQLHLEGTGIGGLGDVLIMPTTGAVRTDKGTQAHPELGYASHYSHADERVRPGYYSVKLADYGIGVELTASERVAFHRYRFPVGKEAHVIVDLKEGTNNKSTNTYIEQTDAYTLKGYRFSTGWAKDARVYFAIRSQAPITKFQVYEDSVLLEGGKGRGKAIKGLVSFDQSPGLLQWKVGISPVSADNALANIDAEIPGWDFDEVARQADEKWNKELSKIKIEGRGGAGEEHKAWSEENKKIFYTALFHTMIDPALFNDYNGDYRGTDKEVYLHAPFQNYTVFSLWDTYRALNPLYTLIQPERVGDMINTMLAICRQQGKLPVWHLEGCETNTMPGVSSVQVVAEAYLKGIKGFDPEAAWGAVKQTMMNKTDGLDYDQADRAIPSDKISESVARGLEYSVSNASVALMARRLGSREDQAYFEKRFHNYGLYYDPVTGFFRGKRADGSWEPVFDPAKSSRPWINDLSEGNHWQYLWLVPEDVEGLIKLQGGDRRFVSRLDSLFSLPVLPDPNAPPDIAGLIGQYAHGDEPGHHTIYLYAYAGQQWKTAEKARYILKNLYPDNVDGLSGNEDCGQMSAWYVLSALGFYPVFPANGGYVLGSPLFDKATIELPGGRPFTVETVNNSPENIYIQSAEWNGKPYTKSYILHATILEGGVLRIRMGPKPNFNFGSKAADRPHSVYAGGTIAPAPSAGTQRFKREFAPTEDFTKAQERPYRDGVCLNGSWKFMPVEGAKRSGADQSGADRRDSNRLRHPEIPENPVWEGVSVKVPAPWNVNSFAGGGEEPRGGDFVTYPSYPKKWETVKAGWLMRKLPYKEAWKGKRLILHFDAVAGYAKVFVNKKEVGEHFDNFLPFDLDITDKIDRGGDNELLIWVADAGLFNEPGKYGRRIYAGGSFWGQHIIGIWQDVWLSVKPVAYVANTFIEPGVSRDELRAEVIIRNESDVAGTFRVSGIVLPWIDLAGSGVLDAPEPKWKLGAEVLAIDGPEVGIAAQAEQKVTLSIRVKGRLALWSPAHPNLYAMMIKLADKRGDLDRQYNRFGWREAKIVGNRLYLNGEPVVLKGDSWHFMGIPEMTRRYAWAWYSMLKDAGANAVRLHAEPYPPLFLDMADEMGMMVLDETALWASDGGPKIDGEEYWKNANGHVRGLIIRDRNHPSVFGWSVCNENIPVAVNVWHAPEALVERQLSEINRWVATARELDPSRNWISGDGETGRPTELPTIIGHYGDERAYQDWSSQGKLWGIGESGMAYYGTPRQSAVYNGDESYVSQKGRMKGVAEEATRIINLQKKYKASYMSVFNLVWYGLKPLEFGLSDTGRATEVSDGVFFNAFREGRPGVQPERLGPYTSTLNPGYDPGMPLYRTWPLFDAIKAGFTDSGMVKEHWIGESGAGGGAGEDSKMREGGNARNDDAAGGKSAAVYAGVSLLSTDKDSVLYSVLSDMGIAVTGEGKTERSGLVVIDGNYPPGDERSIGMARGVMGGGGTVLVLGARPSSEAVINLYLPDPVELTDRKASSFIVVDQGAAVNKEAALNNDAMMSGLSNADLYFSELSRLPVASCGLSGDFVRKGKVLLKDCNTDWKSWNNQPEYKKTITVIRSEREAKPEGNALVETNVGGGRSGDVAAGSGAGGGRLYFMTLDPLTLYKTSENVFHRLFENLGVAFAGGGGAGGPGAGGGGAANYGNLSAIDSTGTVRNVQVLGAADGTHILRSLDGGVFEFETGASGVAYLSWWIYSPRSVVNLLAEPDLPVLDVRITDIGTGREVNGEGFRLFLNGKPAGNKALPAEKGWNHFSIRVSQPGHQKLTMKFESGNADFLREIQSRVLQE